MECIFKGTNGKDGADGAVGQSGAPVRNLCINFCAYYIFYSVGISWTYRPAWTSWHSRYTSELYIARDVLFILTTFREQPANLAHKGSKEHPVCPVLLGKVAIKVNLVCKDEQETPEFKGHRVIKERLVLRYKCISRLSRVLLGCFVGR